MSRLAGRECLHWRRPGPCCLNKKLTDLKSVFGAPTHQGSSRENPGGEGKLRAGRGEGGLGALRAGTPGSAARGAVRPQAKGEP